MMAAGPEPSGTGPEGAAALVDPDVYQPLLSDEIRKEELSDRLRINIIGKGYSPQVEDSILSQQLETGKKIEQALLSDGQKSKAIYRVKYAIRDKIKPSGGGAEADGSTDFGDGGGELAVGS
ncbi:cytochrome c oxidase subunit 1 [Melia azedarach]|uniref:Cytochrome c oxidase subunit 1 n=1 Tax=Melia azedarach TaxID=155640 RepID=A0ACC1WX96_MELAZ|nr:cytochrome c oxidase subunit 1 [Melia azedarach]